VAALPRLAYWAGPLRRLANLRDTIPGLARATERASGFTAKRALPRWHARPFRGGRAAAGGAAPHGQVVLFVDTFNRYFEADVARAAERVLIAAGYAPVYVRTHDGARPLCCGRTYLAKGDVGAARAEAQRTLNALEPYARRGLPIVGLEPSCLLTLRDEFPSLIPGSATELVAAQALLFEEFVARELDAGRWEPPLRTVAQRALVHGHCHQKAFGAMPAVMRALRAIPGLDAQAVESSCCGMAGMFGYERAHYDISMRMAERDLLPAVRAASGETLIVADGMSCKHQIEHGAGRRPLHVAEVYAALLA